MTSLIEQLEALDSKDACLKGTRFVPIHIDTLKRIIAALKAQSGDE